MTLTGRKRVEPLLPVDHLKKNLLAIPSTAENSIICGREHVIQLLYAYLRLKSIINRGMTRHTWNQTSKKGIEWKNAVELKLTEEFSRQHPVFPVSLVKPYFQTGVDKLSARNKNPPPQDIVEVEDSPGLLKKIIKSRKIRLNCKDQRGY
ncbi:hypothetical protein O181_013094 [Austropuccinia psidii MF-1]|uniref:Uncharacterized protein n=1 Tax=Austropuccinia psidii MF-1 TaxID=1389203 RepID=A0A9Q3GNH8_9BASI|nr:hypothetical protein [Austropuccinia psidii MF-1]